VVCLLVVDLASRGTTGVYLNTHKDLLDSDTFELLVESFHRLEVPALLGGVKRDAEETNGESRVTSSW